VLHCRHCRQILRVKATRVLFGLQGQPQPVLTGLLNSYHDVVEGAAFGYASRLDRWINETANAAWQVADFYYRRCLDRLCDYSYSRYGYR
jgi:hypothetical protein